MGWDVYSSEKTPEQLEVFKNISEGIQKITGTVDCYLEHGDLDCSTCKDMLELATGCSFYENYSSAEVIALNKKANWSFVHETEEAWAYYSAKWFLELCARFELSIIASY